MTIMLKIISKRSIWKTCFGQSVQKLSFHTFFKRGILKNFVNITGKHLSYCPFLLKLSECESVNEICSIKNMYTNLYIFFFGTFYIWLWKKLHLTSLLELKPNYRRITPEKGKIWSRKELMLYIMCL